MAKLSLKNILSGLLSVTQLNGNFTSIENEFNDKVVYRKNPPGEANEMHNPLDMNSNRIVNLPAPQGDTEPARFVDVKNGVNTIDVSVLPSFVGNTDKLLGNDGTNLIFKKSDIAADTVSEMTARTKSSLINGERMYVRGHTTISDGGGGVFYWSSINTDTADAGNIFSADEGGDGRWLRENIDEAFFDVRHFGGSGVTGSVANALAAADTAGGGIVFLPAGTYSVTSDMEIGDNVQLVGEGASSVIQPSAAVTNVISSKDFGTTNRSNISLKNFAIIPATFNDYDQAIRLQGFGFVLEDLNIEGSGSVLGLVEFNSGVWAKLSNLYISGYSSGSPGAGHGLLIEGFDNVHGDVECEGLAVGVNMASAPLACTLEIKAKQCTSDGVIVDGIDNNINITADTCATRWARIATVSGSMLRVVRGSDTSVPTNPVVIDAGASDNVVFTRESVQDNSDGLNIIIGPEFKLGGRKYESVISFSSGDATPDVSNGNMFKTANGAPTSITDFDGGVEGQRITIVVDDANTDFTNGASLVLNGGANWTTAAAGDVLEVLNIGDVWYEVSRSDNT